MDKKEKNIMWIIGLIVVLILLLNMKGCTVEVEESGDISDRLTGFREGHDVPLDIDVDELIEELEEEMRGELGIGELALDGDCIDDLCFPPWVLCNEFCANCYDACEEDIRGCYDGCREPIELSSSYTNKAYQFFEIIPAACAIGIDPLYGCFDACDVEYVGELDRCYDACDDFMCADGCFDVVMECAGGCVIRSNETEVAEWDGMPVTDIAGFYETHFPRFLDGFEIMCTGDWITEEELIGCVDPFLFAEWMCTTNSLNSSMNVCETVGGVWTCTGDAITCEV